MEIFRFVFIAFFGLSALFFLYLGWRRGIRFRYYDYQNNRKEKLRDNFLSTFTVIMCMVVFIRLFTHLSSWEFANQITLYLILATTPIAMLGNSFSSSLAKIMTSKTRDLDVFGLNHKYDNLPLRWYELIPLAFITGQVICYIAYKVLLLSQRTEITTDNAILVSSVLGVIVTCLVTLEIYRKF